MNDTDTVTVRFIPQAWVNDCAIQVDPAGPTTFTVAGRQQRRQRSATDSRERSPVDPPVERPVRDRDRAPVGDTTAVPGRADRPTARPRSARGRAVQRPKGRTRDESRLNHHRRGRRQAAAQAA
jgi:hypothetical protein